MAAAMTTPDVVVRAARPGEGRAVAALWRELWDAHEEWGGYAGSKEERVYDQLAARLEEDARVRGGHPVLGRHVHLVAASSGGELLGQVEGWFERHGVDASTPATCEVRSLVVRASTRRAGAGRALLETLARQAHLLARGAPCVLAAEVLEPNPAHGFYARVGYSPVAWTARIFTDAPVSRLGAAATGARIASPDDALAVAMLDATLAARRRAAGDLRFDRPRAIDATMVGAIAAHLAHIARTGGEPTELVAVDERGVVRASASLAVMPLDPPFLPARRGILGRFAVDPASDPRRLLAPLVALGCRIAASRGAASMELTDLTAPGTPIHAAALATGAAPWSRVVTKLA